MATAGKKAVRSSKKAVAPVGKSKYSGPPRPKTPEERAEKRASIEADPVRKKRSQEWREGQKAIAAKFALPPLPDEKPGRGRPPKGTLLRPKPEELSEAAVEEFKQMVAMGVPIKVIAQYPSMPSECSLWYAIADADSLLSSAYASGKQIAVARIEEEIEAVAKTPHIGVLRTKRQAVTRDGGVVDLEEEREVEMVDHRRLLIDSLRWSLAHIRPSKHGKNAQGGDESNDQLKGLFASLRAGPVKSE